MSYLIYVAYKVKKEYVEFIKKEVSKNKTIIMNDLLIKLKEKYNEADISLMQVHRIVKDINITLKQQVSHIRYSNLIF